MAVHLTDLREGTFYAELHLLSAGQEVVVSARPSDAIAVAIRLGAIPILVDEELFAKVAIELGDVDVDSSDDASVDPEDEVRRFRDFLEDLDPDDFLEG